MRFHLDSPPVNGQTVGVRCLSDDPTLGKVLDFCRRQRERLILCVQYSCFNLLIWHIEALIDCPIKISRGYRQRMDKTLTLEDSMIIDCRLRFESLSVRSLR